MSPGSNTRVWADIDELPHRTTLEAEGTLEIRWDLAVGEGCTGDLMLGAPDAESSLHQRFGGDKFRVVDEMIEILRMPLIPA